MKDIDKSDAPLGYVAAEPIKGCLECAFDDGLNVHQACSDCAGYNRADRQDVIFKPAE